jgi:alpha-tubulin suppressor-like RCC1 family protein
MGFFSPANTCLFSSGFNELGQLGIGYKSPNKASPTLHHVGFFDTHRLGHQIKLGCGGAFSVAASDDGRIYVWGSGEKGELGLGDGFALKSYGIPHVVALPVIRSPKVKLLSCGLNHTIVVTGMPV